MTFLSFILCALSMLGIITFSMCWICAEKNGEPGVAGYKAGVCICGAVIWCLVMQKECDINGRDFHIRNHGCCLRSSACVSDN